MTNPGVQHEILAEAAARYDFDIEGLELIRDVTNPVYAVEVAGRPSILRLSSAENRTLSMIRGELEWMAYLKGNGIGVPEVRPSRSGHKVETVSALSEVWYAVLFEKVAGVHPERELLTDTVLRAWGRLMGKMHRLAQAYRPSVPALRRPDWNDLDVFQFESRMPPKYREENTAVIKACNQMTGHLRGLPTPPEAYGLIHADLEPWNILLDGERLTVIDFEECCYCWYAFDLAVALSFGVLASWKYEILELGNEENDRHVQHVWDLMSSGYRQENSLADTWLEAMPIFLRFRVMQDYVHGLRELASGSTDEWLLDFLRKQRYIIEYEVTFSHIRWL